MAARTCLRDSLAPAEPESKGEIGKETAGLSPGLGLPTAFNLRDRRPVQGLPRSPVLHGLPRTLRRLSTWRSRRKQRSCAEQRLSEDFRATWHDSSQARRHSRHHGGTRAPLSTSLALLRQNRKVELSPTLAPNAARTAGSPQVVPTTTPRHFDFRASTRRQRRGIRSRIAMINVRRALSFDKRPGSR